MSGTAHLSLLYLASFSHHTFYPLSDLLHINPEKKSLILFHELSVGLTTNLNNHTQQ
jgi:hypothetical protein